MDNKDNNFVLFLSGKMTGEPEFNFPMFNRYAKILRDRGFKVINPAEFATHDDWSWEDYMRRSISFMLHADVIVLLPNFYNSRGAREELHVAGITGMEILKIEDLVKE